MSGGLSAERRMPFWMGELREVAAAFLVEATRGRSIGMCYQPTYFDPTDPSALREDPAGADRKCTERGNAHREAPCRGSVGCPRIAGHHREDTDGHDGDPWHTSAVLEPLPGARLGRPAVVRVIVCAQDGLFRWLSAGVVPRPASPKPGRRCESSAVGTEFIRRRTKARVDPGFFVLSGAAPKPSLPRSLRRLAVK